MKRFISMILTCSLLTVSVGSNVWAAEATASDGVQMTATDAEKESESTGWKGGEMSYEEMESQKWEQEKTAEEIMEIAALNARAASTTYQPVLTDDQWNTTLAFKCMTTRNSITSKISFQGAMLKENCIVPGLAYTSFETDACRNMVPQGIAYVHGYILISAYCVQNKHTSVLHVIDQSTYQYQCSLNLGIQAHVGGLAYDTDSGYLWVCDSKKQRLVAYDMKYLDLCYIHDAQSLSCKMRDIGDCAEKPTDINPSFCTYADGVIWVGNCNQTGSSIVHAYVANKNILVRGASLTGPKNVQGMAIYRTGRTTCCVLTSSYGRRNDSTVHSYTIDDYTVKIGSVEMGITPIKTITMPGMMEGIVVNGSQTYAVFESAANAYRGGNANSDGKGSSKNPCDRVGIFSTRYIFE